jgi:hypothetical protein
LAATNQKGREILSAVGMLVINVIAAAAAAAAGGGGGGGGGGVGGGGGGGGDYDIYTSGGMLWAVIK